MSTNTAAEAISLPAFTPGEYSVVMRLKASSSAEFKSSPAITASQAQTQSSHWTGALSVSVSAAHITASTAHSCRKAVLLFSAQISPDRE